MQNHSSLKARAALLVNLCEIELGCKTSEVAII